MDLKQIKELMISMEKIGVKRLRVKEEKGFELELELESTHVHPPIAHSEMRQEHHHHTQFHPPRPFHPKQPEMEEKKPQHVEGKFVSSPMVGTFYVSSSPDDPHFVKVGDRVEEDTIVCIVEAMKVMNEVKAGIKGEVAEVLIDNGQPVEFGTKMFRIV